MIQKILFTAAALLVAASAYAADKPQTLDRFYFLSVADYYAGALLAAVLKRKKPLINQGCCLSYAKYAEETAKLFYFTAHYCFLFS